VRCLGFDPSNEWFCTGAADRTIKIWDTASGQLKLTLTGHIEQVGGAGRGRRGPGEAGAAAGTGRRPVAALARQTLLRCTHAHAGGWQGG
jgi:hypothetical protein